MAKSAAEISRDREMITTARGLKRPSGRPTQTNSAPKLFLNFIEIGAASNIFVAIMNTGSSVVPLLLEAVRLLRFPFGGQLTNIALSLIPGHWLLEQQPVLLTWRERISDFQLKNHNLFNMRNMFNDDFFGTGGNGGALTG